MRLEQIFPLIASLAILVWLAPGVVPMSPKARRLAPMVALGLVVLGIVMALGAFIVR